ncbi:hypothetical protein HQ544_03820 [Candidatus Falkowbacteria bacterium]|nr:hypothetical protein [Candidatus Falkowbacteria bacterium]
MNKKVREKTAAEKHLDKALLKLDFPEMTVPPEMERLLEKMSNLAEAGVHASLAVREEVKALRVAQNRTNELLQKIINELCIIRARTPTP